MSIYIALMFLGGGLSSWLGTAVYEKGGWLACVGFVSLLSFIVLVLGVWSWRQEQQGAI
jgi:predicted MFS family arabinose efflux permease